MASEQTAEGVVKWYSLARGYGFIVRDRDQAEIFVHHSAVADDAPHELRDGERVRFEVVEGPRGLLARKVRRLAP